MLKQWNNFEEEKNMKITTEAQYQRALKKVGKWMELHPDGETAEKEAEMRTLAEAIEAYEDIHYPMPMHVTIRKPKTLQDVIEIKMFERRMKRKDMAKLLGISDTRLSEVMNGKRKVNIDLAKRLYKKLDVDPKFILEKA